MTLRPFIHRNAHQPRRIWPTVTSSALSPRGGPGTKATAPITITPELHCVLAWPCPCPCPCKQQSLTRCFLTQRGRAEQGGNSERQWHHPNQIQNQCSPVQSSPLFRLRFCSTAHRPLPLTRLIVSLHKHPAFPRSCHATPLHSTALLLHCTLRFKSFRR